MGFMLAFLLSAQAGVPLQDHWRVHTTQRFAIYYTSDVEPELVRVARVAERAYRQVSSDLARELDFKVTLVLFKSQDALEQRTSTPGPPEHVMIALDRPDELAGRITHELTHVFQFHIWPRSALSRVPPWVLEGLAEYERGFWSEADRAQLRAAVGSNALPKLTALSTAGAEPRLIHNLGHAAFEFIGGKYGNEGIRRFLSALADEASGSDPHRRAFGLTADEFARDFERYLERRFRS